MELTESQHINLKKESKVEMKGGMAYSSTFGGALAALRDGYKVQRSGWNGKGMWIQAQFPDEHSKMTHPYLYIEYPIGHIAYPNGSRVPWLPSQTDILAEDWNVVTELV